MKTTESTDDELVGIVISRMAKLPISEDAARSFLDFYLSEINNGKSSEEAKAAALEEYNFFEPDIKSACHTMVRSLDVQLRKRDKLQKTEAGTSTTEVPNYKITPEMKRGAGKNDYHDRKTLKSDY